MKILKKFVCLLLCVCTCLTFTACECSSENGDYADFYYFNTQITVQVNSKTLSDSTKDKISALLKELDDGYKISNQNSLTYKFNSLSVGGSMQISDFEQKIFEDCLNFYSFSEKKFNPAVLPLSELWQFYPSYPVQNFTPPTLDSISQMLSSGILDFENAFTITDGVLTKLTNAKIDFGGIIKGYAVDKVGQILERDGYTDGYVNAGGSSLRILDADGLGIIHPRKDGQIINVTKRLKDISVSTSGDYQRYYQVENQRYSHIIDTLSGMPMNTGVQSATVLCPDASFADALSTALCLCEYSDSNNQLTDLCQKILQTYPDTWIFVALEKDSQKIVLTNKTVNQDFTLLDQTYQVVKI